MADEPNKRIDALLRSYADKRRQDTGAPFELHPATRQLLQGEVARVYRKGAAGSPFARLLTYWPRLAFAAACLAITLTLVLIVLPRQTVTEMAQSKLEPASESFDRKSGVAGEDEKLALRDGFGNQRAPAVSTAPIAPTVPLDSLARGNEADAAKPTSDSAIESRKDSTVALMREELAVAEREKRAADKPVPAQSEASLRFYANTPDVSRTAYVQQKQDGQLGVRLQNVQAVLNNFQLEQKGDQIRIIDADGSVYAGKMLAEQELKKEQAANVGQVAGAAGPAPAAESQRYFRAIGTNRSLQQQVSIEANIVQVQTNAAPAPGLAPARRLNERAPAQQQNAAQQQNTIRGRAVVGKDQELQINAVPAQP